MITGASSLTEIYQTSAPDGVPAGSNQQTEPRPRPLLPVILF